MPAPVDDFPTAGMIGGGQLARMTQQAAIGLGVELRVLARDAAESAARVVSEPFLGDHDDAAALREFAAGVDVITFDHEHVPPALLRELIELGTPVRPSPEALIHAQDKITMRRELSQVGLPCPEWDFIPDDADDEQAATVLAAFGDRVGWPIVMKTSRGGYDGRGVWVVDDLAQACAVLREAELAPNALWLVEEKVDFVRELAAQVARSPHGQAVAYPVVQTVQTDGICTEVIAPAPNLAHDRAIEAQRIALEVAQVVGVTGMLAVELFDTGDRLLINELAMRPHNSGHWSIDGAVTSQFENHLRAVLDLPLGSPAARDQYTVMVNVLGTERKNMYAAYKHVLARDPRLKVHMYGKEPRAGRKLGHVCVGGDDLEQLLTRAHHAADYLAGVIDE